VQLIDNPVELPNFPICRIRREKLLISVGRLVPQKGYDLLIGAFQSSLFQHDDWKLVVLGEGKDRASLEALVLERGLDRQVSLPGIVKSIEEWYRIASLFILTSRYEGTPNAALEAMANEIPILITNTCGEMPNIVQDKVNGLVAERSESKVREKLDWAYENQPLMAGIGRAGRGTVQKYERKAVAKKWLDLIIRVS
jgi:glycosyltransferase involved in cell wall biosynthesis